MTLNRSIKSLFVFCFITLSTNAQISPVDVADLTLKIGGMGSEDLFYGFEEGDQILFSFEEVQGKELKEIEILELPGSSKFMDFKSTSLQKKINVYKRGVYQFRFANGALGGRVCKIHIQRVPKSDDLIPFNTNWVMKTVFDTTYESYTEDSLIGYDTIRTQKHKKELVKKDTIITELFSRTERVHSATAIDKTPHAYFDVNLPKSTYSPNIFNPYESTQVISWSYWLGVGQTAKEDYEKVNENLATGIKAIGLVTGYGALATLAISGISMFGTPIVGDNVQYDFVTFQNGMNKVIVEGNGIAASGRGTNPLQGAFTVHLYNDNFRDGIDVTVKVIAFQLKKTWEDVEYTEESIEPKFVSLNKKKMNVNSKQLRVNAE